MTMTDNDVVRSQSFTADGPIEIDVALGAGRVDVTLGEHADRTAADTAPAASEESRADDANGSAPGAAHDDADHTVGAAAPDATESAAAGAGHDTDTDAHGDTGHGTDSDADGDSAEFVTDPAGDATYAAGSGVGAGTSSASPYSPASGTTGSTVTGADASNEITVEIRRATTAADDWGISGLLSWVNGQFGGQLGSFGNADLAAHAIRETEVALHGRRLVVHAPKDSRLRAVPLHITVRAPGGSSVRTNGGSADVTVEGQAGRVDVHTGSGRVRVERASEPVDVRSGSGAVLVGEALGGLAARGGSSDVHVTTLGGEGAVETGSGNVEIGTVDAGGVHVRTGSGNVEVRDAAAGSLRLHTGSGMLTIGIRQGVDAELNVSSGSGRVMNEFDVSSEPPSGDRPVSLRVTGRTGSGSIVLRRGH